jgi:hypothetical protein
MYPLPISFSLLDQTDLTISSVSVSRFEDPPNAALSAPYSTLITDLINPFVSVNVFP